MEELNELAELMFANVNETIDDLEKKYPKRNLQDGAEVTRFAPSPTGFLHTGAVFSSLVNRYVANQTKGVFYLRIEDTDTKREVEGSTISVVKELHKLGISPDEGMQIDGSQRGDYAPYIQSQRERIYLICAKELVKKGRAYPCFCTSDEIDSLRKMQEEQKIVPGYYGVYARCRNLTTREMIDKIKAGDKYIVRFKSQGSHMKKVSFVDEIRGRIEMAENDLDIVIIKSDGLPTYHFAHAVDDHFMRTTMVIRGEEWISSVALHLELFNALGFEKMKYAHVPTIMKNDNGSKRKLSKRKDREAAVSYFEQAGYPTEALLEYLLNIVNADFENWRKQNEKLPLEAYTINLKKMNAAGALFDMVKLIDVSKNVIGRMDSETLYIEYLKWASEFDEIAHTLCINNQEYIKKIFAIERDNAVKVRKDFACYSEILPNISYFIYDMYEQDIEGGFNFDFKENTITKQDVKDVLTKYCSIHNVNVAKEEWFESVKRLSEELGYQTNMKEYKLSPDKYKGSIADVTGFIRVALTNRRNTPDIYTIMQVLGTESTLKRINTAIKNLE